MPPKPTCKVVKREGQRGARIDPKGCKVRTTKDAQGNKKEETKHGNDRNGHGWAGVLGPRSSLGNLADLQARSEPRTTLDCSCSPANTALRGPVSTPQPQDEGGREGERERDRRVTPTRRSPSPTASMPRKVAELHAPR